MIAKAGFLLEFRNLHPLAIKHARRLEGDIMSTSNLALKHTAKPDPEIHRNRRLLPLALGICLAASAARADVVTDWNIVAFDTIAVTPNYPLQTRNLAMVHAAVYDAVNSIERRHPAYKFIVPALPGASRTAAAAQAAAQAGGDRRPAQDGRGAGPG